MTKDYDGFQEFMRIYLGSFPANEIIPVGTLLSLVSRGHMRLEAVEDRGKVIGMHMTSMDTPATFIGFLAVDAGLRSQGYGGRILEILMSEGKPVFLNVEPPEEQCSNRAERESRIRFYINHGLELTDYRIDLGSGIFRIMTNRMDRLSAYRETISLLGFDWPIERIER